MAKEKILDYTPISIVNACSVKMGNKIYIFGGNDDLFTYLNTIYEYNIDTDSYTLLTWTLPTALKNMCGCACGSTIYLFGGYDSGNTLNTTIYKFTTATGVATASVDPITIDPINAYLYVEPDETNKQIVISGKTDSFDVLDITNATVQTYTESDLGNVYNFYTMKYWMTFNSTTLTLFESDDLVVGSFMQDKVIPEEYDSIEKVECVDDYTFLIVTLKNTTRTLWRYNAFYNTISKQATMLYSKACSVATDYDKHLYFFGGFYSDGVTPSDMAVMYDFNYYEIRLLYSSSRIDVSNTATEILISDGYFNTISPINSGNNIVFYNVSGRYGDEDISNYLTYDGVNASISILSVNADIYINITSELYHMVNFNLSDGIILNNYNNAWRRYTDFIRTFTLADDYVLKDVKIYNGSTDITSTVYDSDTKTITLDHTNWNTYNDISFYITATLSTLKLNLYKNTSLNNVVDKNIVYINKISGNARDNISISNPSILIDTSTIDVSLANYVYIENFKRYYFITSVDIVRTNLWRINLKVDVLMSYKNEILNVSCIVSRSASDYNKKLPDAEDVLSPNPIIEIKEAVTDVFDQSATTNRFLLITNQ